MGSISFQIPNHPRPSRPTAARASCRARLHESQRVAMFSTSTDKTAAAVGGCVEPSPINVYGVGSGGAASWSAIAGSDAISVLVTHTCTGQRNAHKSTDFPLRLVGSRRDRQLSLCALALRQRLPRPRVRHRSHDCESQEQLCGYSGTLGAREHWHARRASRGCSTIELCPAF